VNEQFMPIGRVARWTVILLVAIVVLDVIAAFSDLAEIRLLDRIIEGEPVTDDEADASDTRQAVIGAVQFLVYAATAFVFIRWFRRAYRNFAPLGAERTRFKSWWTIAGWFIPIWNVFRPKQLLNDIWRGSDPGLPPRTDAWRDADVPGFFLLWWLLWLASTYADQVALRLAFTGDSPDELRDGSVAYLVTDVVDAVLALLAIVVVRMTTTRQEERAAALGTAYGALPADDET
jgi:Domain of unknown function (DUF4328)